VGPRTGLDVCAKSCPHWDLVPRPFSNLTIIQSDYCKRWRSHNALFNYCMDLTLEDLKMTQVESKHVALLM
jgi:hypothetical protein